MKIPHNVATLGHASTVVSWILGHGKLVSTVTITSEQRCVVVDAVYFEPISAAKFPAKGEEQGIWPSPHHSERIRYRHAKKFRGSGPEADLSGSLLSSALYRKETRTSRLATSPAARPNTVAVSSPLPER